MDMTLTAVSSLPPTRNGMSEDVHALIDHGEQPHASEPRQVDEDRRFQRRKFQEHRRITSLHFA
jgi:hypothetical protein